MDEMSNTQGNATQPTEATQGQAQPQPQQQQPQPSTPEGNPVGELSSQGTAQDSGLDKDNPLGVNLESPLDKAEQPSSEVVPENYASFRDTDGNEYAPEDVGDFITTAKELGLSQENAQKVFSAMVPATQKYLRSSLERHSKEWAQAAQNDPEFGGVNFNQNVGIAKKAYDAYATPELKKMMAASGLGNHPEFIRMFWRIGKGLQQDHGVAGSASAPASRRSRFPNTPGMVDDI